MTYILNEAQEAWLKALESGEYPQGRGRLFDGKSYCCIGVACAVAGLVPDEDNRFLKDSGIAPDEIREALRLRTAWGDSLGGDLIIGGEGFSSLVRANDAGCTFPVIAKAIRANPTAVFVE